MKKTRTILIVILLVVVVVVFHTVRRNATMRGIESTVAADSRQVLLTPTEVDSLILVDCPALLHTDIKKVDSKAIEKNLALHPYVLRVSAHMTMGGKLKVDVVQHKPVVRMFLRDKEFYLSRQGTLMPLSATHYCHLLVGSFADGADPKGITKVWKLAAFLSDNPAYGDVFDQVCLDPKGDLYLVPKLGDLVIQVGDTNALDDKFRNLWAFFDQGVNQVGWDTYKSISLKYRGQVVCTKRN